MKRFVILFLFVGLANFAFSQRLVYEQTGDIFPQLVWSASAWADFDLNGKPDLLFFGAEGESSVPRTVLYVNTGIDFVEVDSTGLPDLELGAVAVGDFNGDDYPDILLQGYYFDNDTSWAVTDVYLNNGDLTFTRLNTGTPNMYTGSVDVADFDQDGDLDFVAEGFDNDSSVYRTLIMLNNGDSTFTPLAHQIPGLYFGAVRFGDFNGDGYPDLLASGYGSDFYTALWKNVNGDTLVQTDVPFFQVWLGDAQWCDLNSDGNLDLILTGYGGPNYTRNTLVYLGTGDSLIQDTTFGFIGVSHSVVAVRDFDNDGDQDVFITGLYGDGMGSGEYVSRVYLNDNMDFSQTIDLVPVYWGGSSACDYNKDSLTDIFLSGYGFDDNAGQDYDFAALFKASVIANVEDNPGLKLVLFPNPVYKQLSVNSPVVVNELLITDLQGKTVLRSTAGKKRIVLNLSDLNSGVYVIRLFTEKGQATAKFVKY